MLVSEAIEKIDSYCSPIGMEGEPIEAATTRDQVLWGNVDQKCTGIVTCIWATSDVIRKAQALGANLIVSHEALWWNHGDRTDWLAGNAVFQAKRDLLDAGGTVVWRLHDRIHGGIPAPDAPAGTSQLANADGWVDGIFAPLAATLGWDHAEAAMPVVTLEARVSPTTARELAVDVCRRLGHAGVRVVGDPEAPVRLAMVPMHVLGPLDDAIISHVEEAGVDCILSMECTDFTLAEYVRDSCQQGRPRAIVNVGHFNLEEPGMEYATQWLPKALGDESPEVTFVSTEDPYAYVTL
ncbi:MAG: hypothetical protein WAY93_10735 [Atopobiaceae bacterium]|jgi:putative NIF3 family GTP cyclohydrolase 1 type 2|nr:Nif3-like dinuclear metal center hexameric protein [Atopobiaceae bacterium]